MSGQSTIAAIRKGHGGFLTVIDLAAIANDPATRLTPILVRCNGGRFTAPAQDVEHFIALIEAVPAGRTNPIEYVCDVSLAAGH